MPPALNPRLDTLITLLVSRRIVLVSIVLVILAGALLVALPLVLAPVASERLTAALGLPVGVGRVVVSAVGPRVSAYGITLRPAANDAPVATLGAIHANLAFGRLLRGELALDSLTLHRPRVTIRRTASGDIDLAALLPPPERDATAEDVAPDETHIAIDAFRIRDGIVEFHDETTTPPITTTLRVDSAQADDLDLTRNGHTRIALRSASRIDDDAFTLELSYEAAGTNSSLTAHLRTTAASLARVLVHARLDWEHVAGAVDAEATYVRTVVDGALTAHRVTIDATATDLALADSAADAATLRAATATLTGMTIDLAAQRLDLGTITAEDFWALAYRDDTGLHVPFATPAPERDAPASAWSTELRRVTLGAGTLVLRDLPPGSRDLPITVRSGHIATEDDAVRFVFDTEVAGGTIGIDGRARPNSTTVQLTFDALDVAAVAAHLGVPIAFASGKLGGTLDGVFQDGPGRFTGRLVATDVKSAPSEAHPEEVFAWATLEIELAESTFAPPRIHATHAALTWPYLMLHRRPDGVYPFTGVTTAPETPRPPSAATTGEAVFVLDRGTIAHGRIEFYDTVLDEAYGTDILDLGGTIQELRAAPLTIANFALEGSIDELSPITARGDVRIDRIDSELAVERLRLVPLSRYIEPGIKYEVTAGTATIATRLRRRKALITAANDIDLARLKLRSSGRDPFKGELGVALPVALALMKDSRGHIALNLPVSVDLDTLEYNVGTSIVSAVRRAVLGTLQSPVRILGAVLLGKGGDVFDLKPVSFTAGSATLTDAGAERVGQLARLLTRHAGLDLVLLPQMTAADAEALGDGDSAASTAANPRALATTRADVIRRTLRDSYGIDPERVRARAPQTDRRKKSTPGVDVQLRGH